MSRVPSFLLVAAVLLTIRITETQPQEMFSICSQKNPIYVDRISRVIGTIRSPSSNETISSTQECRVKFVISATNLRLEVASFHLAGQDPCSSTQEHLSIQFSPSNYYYRGDVDTIRWCGQSYSPLFTTSENFELVYYPGPKAVRGSGFTINVFADYRQQCYSGRSEVGSEPMYFFSPGYPGPYAHNIFTCSWDITSKHNRSLRLETLRFYLEYSVSCSYDCLLINKDEFSGDKRVQLTTSGGRLVLTFSTDHSRAMDGYVIKVVETASEGVCQVETVVGSAPVLLQPPVLEPGYFSSNCWWLLKAESDDQVVLLDTKRFEGTTICSEFELKVHDGNSSKSQRIISGCAPAQIFQTIRSSSRYLFVDIDLAQSGYPNGMKVEFAATSSLRVAPPRVLYASRASSFVWLDLDTYENVSLLLRGERDNPKNYDSCLRISVKRNPEDPQPLNISDFFYAYSGWNKTFAELGSACGRPSSEEVLSYGSKIYISRGKVAFRAKPNRIWLIYTLQHYCIPEVVSLQTSLVPGVLRSDRIKSTTASGYPNNNYCRWLFGPQDSLFTTLAFNKSMLFAQGCYDNITIYENNFAISYMSRLKQWCDSETPTVVSAKGNALLLEFITDYANTSQGFVLNYTQSSLVGQCPSFSTIVAGDEPQNISSPNYPHDYPNNMDCKWRIHTPKGIIQMKLENLNIHTQSSKCSQNDFLVIYDGPQMSSPVLLDICGDDPMDYRPIISTSPYVLVHFHSDEMYAATGFLLTYQSSTDPALWKCRNEVHLQADQDSEITSPFYPNPFPEYSDCFWVAMAPLTKIVMLEVVDMDMSCGTGSVVLYDGQNEDSLLLARLCSNQYTKYYTSTQKIMYITFKTFSVSPMTQKGFKLRLRSWEASDQCGGTVTHLYASANKQYINSPNYPDNYPPNSNCEWRIESSDRSRKVYVQIDDAKLESSYTCNFDFVSVYDGFDVFAPRIGKYCGSHKVSWWSEGVYLFIKFQSDGHTQYRGFRLAYWTISEAPSTTPEPTAAKSDGDSSVGAVIGGVMGGVVLLLLGITIFMCYMGRCRRANPPASPRSGRSGGGRGGSAPPAYHASGSPTATNTVFVVSPVIVNQQAPPPYPGNHSAGGGGLAPPPYPAPREVIPLIPPPGYAEVDAPPPYSETMIDFYPPATPTDRSPNPSQGDDGSDLGASRSASADRLNQLDHQHCDGHQPLAPSYNQPSWQNNQSQHDSQPQLPSYSQPNWQINQSQRDSLPRLPSDSQRNQQIDPRDQVALPSYDEWTRHGPQGQPPSHPTNGSSDASANRRRPTPTAAGFNTTRARNAHGERPSARERSVGDDGSQHSSREASSDDTWGSSGGNNRATNYSDEARDRAVDDTAGQPLQELPWHGQGQPQDAAPRSLRLQSSLDSSSDVSGSLDQMRQTSV